MNVSLQSQSEKSPEIKIRVATDEWEKKQIYQFRYEVFVEECARTLTSADHKDKKISDSMDEHSILLYAEANAELVGTMRITIGDIAVFPPPLRKIFSMEKFHSILQSFPNQNLGLTTKLAVKPEYRGSTVMYQLIVENFKISQGERLQFSFGAGNPHLISLYERIGYRRFTKNFTDPGYGLLVPIVFVAEDAEYLRKIHSPLYRLVKNSPYIGHNIGEKFQQAFPEAAKHINTRLISKEYVITYIMSKFPRTPLSKLPIFQDLSTHDIVSFLQFGAIFPCTQGDCIISSRETGNELYFLLSGAAVWETEQSAAFLHPGQCFGSGDLTNPVVYSATVTAVIESEIIIITHQDFEKFSHQHAEIATVIHNNLSSITELSFQNNTNISQSKEGQA